MKNQSFASSVFYSLTLLALSATLLLAGCKEDASTTAPYTIDLAVLPIVFVMDAEQAAMATGTGTGWGSSDNSGRSNTDICCPSIQIIGETFSDDLRLARPDDAFIENPFGMMIDTDPADPIVIELKDADGNSVGTFSLQVDKGEGIAINEPKLSPGEYLLNITVGQTKLLPSLWSIPKAWTAHSRATLPALPAVFRYTKAGRASNAAWRNSKARSDAQRR